MCTKHLPAGILSTQTKANTCCNMLKTPACRYFGHIVYLISQAATCSKHVPAGISGTSKTLYRERQQALWPAQNVCRHVFWTHQVHYGTCCNLLKTSAGKYFGYAMYIMKHVATCSKRLPVGILVTPGILWNMLYASPKKIIFAGVEMNTFLYVG